MRPVPALRKAVEYDPSLRRDDVFSRLMKSATARISSIVL